MKDLITFCETTPAFDNNSKLKVLLFATGAKPNTYVHLRITNNLHDKHRFEHFLKKNKILYSVSKPKGFEEIDAVTPEKASWHIKGVWFGYDLYKDNGAKKNFEKAIALIKKGKHQEADVILGKHYGYPSCCVAKFIEEHDPKMIAKKYTAAEYYGKLHTLDRTFPFLTHTPCSATCAVSLTLNRMYESTLKREAPAFHKKYSETRTYRMDIVIDEENDIVPFKNPNAHDYVVITMQPLEGHYQLMSWPCKDKFTRGTVLHAKITLRYDYADIVPIDAVKAGKGFHHERHFRPHV